MDHGMVNRILPDYTRKKKSWVLLLAAIGFSSYGAFRAYSSPLIAQKTQKVSNVLGALVSIAEIISETAETIGVVSKDLKDFLQTKSDEIPNSLKQISKLTRSDEFSESVVTLTQALTMGIMRGFQSSETVDHDSSGKDGPCFLEKILDKLSTPAGSGFVSAIVGSFARNLVVGFYEAGKSDGDLDGNANDSIGKWVDLICSSKSKELISDSVQLFVSTAVAVYLEKTMHVNPYEEFFTGMTNPKHEKEVRDVLVSVCSGAVETLVKTSHQVLTKENDDTEYSGLGSTDFTFNQAKAASEVEVCDEEGFSFKSKPLKGFDEVPNSGWFSKVSSILALPSNRRLVLDMTGRATFETVRTFLEFLLDKLSDAIRRCLDIVYEIVVDSCLGAARYVTEKSSVVATVFFSVLLHILDGSWILATA